MAEKAWNQGELLPQAGWPQGGGEAGISEKYRELDENQMPLGQNFDKWNANSNIYLLITGLGRLITLNSSLQMCLWKAGMGRLTKGGNEKAALTKLWLFHNSSRGNAPIHWGHPGLGGEWRGNLQNKTGGKASQTLISLIRAEQFSHLETWVGGQRKWFFLVFFFPKGIHGLVVFSSLTYFELVKNSLQKHSMFINYKYLTHRKQPSYFHFSGWAQSCEQECLFLLWHSLGDTWKAGLSELRFPPTFLKFPIRHAFLRVSQEFWCFCLLLT